MKNIYVVPTVNYRQDYALKSGEVIEVVRLGQLIKNSETNELLINKNSRWAASCDTDVLVPHHIYITSDEEIKAGDWFLDTVSHTVHNAILAAGVFNTRKKIILTTDHDLIKEGVQPIDDEFLEWFVENPSCEEIEVDDYPIIEKYNPKGEYVHTSNWIYEIIIPDTTADFINYPPELEPVLAKISHQNDLGLSTWYEVVYWADEKWSSYSGSKTFENGERVLEWVECQGIFKNN